MKCVRCKNVDMKTELYEGVEVDRCPKCQGTWLDTGELVKILHNHEHPIGPKIVEATLKTSYAGVPQDEQRSIELCPKCGQQMRAVNYDYSSGIIIDTCSEHGVWLDGPELDKIQAHSEEWDRQMDLHKQDWINMVKAVDAGRKDAEDQINSQSMRPTKYAVNRIIRKLLGD